MIRYYTNNVNYYKLIDGKVYILHTDDTWGWIVRSHAYTKHGFIMKHTNMHEITEGEMMLERL